MKYLLFFVLIVLCVAEVYVIMKFGKGKTLDKAAFLLTIVGFYGLAIGFIKNTAIGDSFSELLEEMTSHHPIKFIAGNFTCIGFILNFLSLGYSKYRNPESSMLLGHVGTLFMIIAFPILIFYAFFHLFVITPLTYVAYLFSSAIVEAISGASNDIMITQTSATGEKKEVKLKGLMLKNQETAKSFIVGIYATMLGFAAKIVEVLGLF